MSDLVWSDYFDNDREAGTGCKPAEHPDTMSAWFRYDAECKRQGLIPGSYTAFKAGYQAGKSTDDSQDEICGMCDRPIGGNHTDCPYCSSR